MNDETIVAIFDTPDHAAAAVRDLETAGIASSAISQHAASSATGATSTAKAPHQEPGFWASLFGAEPEYGHDNTVYDRSLQSGSTVVTVRGNGTELDKALDILERHNPVDIDERAGSYGVMATSVAATGATATAGALSGQAVSGQPTTLQLSEEALAVGKRAINRGTTRVRRYVVETPVEETVNLRDEHVSVERRPVSDSRATSNADFSEKVIELTETAEEAVVSKTAHVREEVVIRKDVADRTETVRDTLRREDVEITKEPGLAPTSPGLVQDKPRF